jgi:hypothetical protein
MLSTLEHPRVASEHVHAGVPGEAFKGGIDVLDGPVVVGDDDAVTHRLQGRIQPQHLELLEPPPIGDVHECHNDARQFVCAGELGEGVHQHPPEVPGTRPFDPAHQIPLRQSRGEDLIDRVFVHRQGRAVFPHETPRGVVVRLAREIRGRDAQQFGSPVVNIRMLVSAHGNADVQVRDEPR